MSIRIDSRLCVGCGRCAESCPGNLLRLNAAGKAEIPVPQDCWGCTACLKECRTGAIAFYLGADLGGRGSTLRVKMTDDVSLWTVTRRDGTEWQIEVKRQEANRY